MHLWFIYSTNGHWATPDARHQTRHRGNNRNPADKRLSLPGSPGCADRKQADKQATVSHSKNSEEGMQRVRSAWGGQRRNLSGGDISEYLKEEGSQPCAEPGEEALSGGSSCSKDLWQNRACMFVLWVSPGMVHMINWAKRETGERWTRILRKWPFQQCRDRQKSHCIREMHTQCHSAPDGGLMMGCCIQSFI